MRVLLSSRQLNLDSSPGLTCCRQKRCCCVYSVIALRFTPLHVFKQTRLCLLHSLSACGPNIVHSLEFRSRYVSARFWPPQMQFLLLFSRQGKLRLQKWFTPMTEREKKKVVREMLMLVLARPPRSCNFLHWRDLKIVYRRWRLKEFRDIFSCVLLSVFHLLFMLNV